MSSPVTKNSRICILGANGQVGLEVCLFLTDMPNVQVTPVCRTQYGAALLKRLGMECRHGRLTLEEEAGRLLEGAALVADFGWPTNPIGKTDAICRQIRNVIHQAPPGAPYVFISTQSVFCLDPSSPQFTAYRLSKRQAERTALREGRKAGRPVYVLRLGQVHGPLQSVSRAIIREFRAETAYVPAVDSYAVFTYSIAEALANIASGREIPGVYTLLAHPQWRWPEVHAYYSRWTGIRSEAVEESLRPGASSPLTRMWQTLRGFFGNEIFRQREMIEFWSTRVFPRKMQQLRLAHYRRQAAGEIGQLRALKSWRPYGQKVSVPGLRFKGISDIREGIFEKNQWLLERIRSVSSDAATPNPEHE